MITPLAYLNGRFLPFAEAGLSLADAGFVSGATVVDNARTFRHKLFRWPDHLARFRRDCAACFVPLQATDGELTATAEELVAHNAKLLPPGGELQLVTFATPGLLGYYLCEAASGPPTLGMATYPLPFARFRRFFTEGVTLAVAGTQHAGANDLLPPRVKHRSRMVWHIAEKSIAEGVPGAVPVVLNQHGSGETAIGAVLAVADNMVIRPPSSVLLPSISVDVIAELCAAVGAKCEEKPLDLRLLYQPSESQDAHTAAGGVSEVLLAGTSFCVAGVRRTRWRDRCRDYPWPGPVITKLLAAWSELVGVDIARQFTEMGA